MSAKLKFPLIDPDQIQTVVSTKYAIEGYLVLKESTFVFGPPKHLKTFLVLSWLLSIATGHDWFGHRVRRLKVLYFIGEGVDTFIGRIKAWQLAHNVPDLGQYFKVVQRAPNLFDGSLQSTIEEIKSQGFVPDVVAIDTLGRAMGGARETTEDFNQIFHHIDALMQEYLPGLTLVVVGHTRKADLVYRGPQVIAGDCDNLIYVERIEKEYNANVHCEFSRNAAEFNDFGFSCTKTSVITDEGPQDFLAVTNATTAHDTKGQSDDEELAWQTLFRFYQNPDSWTQQTAWFEATKTARGGKLGNSTFSTLTKQLIKAGRVRTSPGGLYQVVLEASDEVTPITLGVNSSRSSRSLPLPDIDLGVGGVERATPRSTPGVREVKSRQSRSVEKSVAPTVPLAPEVGVNYDELDAFGEALGHHPLPSDDQLIATGIEATKKPAKAR
jgi:hypothetical protein